MPLKATNSSHCLAPKFAHYLGISMFNRFVIAEIKPTFRIVLDRPASKTQAAFISPDPDILFLALTTTNQLFVYKLTGADPELICERSIDVTSKCVAFLSESAVAIVQANYAVLLVQLL
jgi:hypothetical protein